MADAPEDAVTQTRAKAEDEALDTEEPSLTFWKRLALLGWVRVGLLLLGLTVLVVGAVNAWRAEESLALLVVGTLFVLIALVLAPDWSSIEVAWGNFSAKLLRDISGRLEKIGAGDDPEELRRELDRLRADLEEQSRRQVRRASTAATPVGRYGLGNIFQQKQTDGPKATHSFRPDGSVELRLVWWSTIYEELICRVAPPEGEAVSTTVRSEVPAAGFQFIRRFKVAFPDEFQGSAAPLPGRYSVRWEPPAPKSEPLFAEAVMGLLDLPLATDEFTLR